MPSIQSQQNHAYHVSTIIAARPSTQSSTSELDVSFEIIDTINHNATKTDLALLEPFISECSKKNATEPQIIVYFKEHLASLKDLLSSDSNRSTVHIKLKEFLAKYHQYTYLLLHTMQNAKLKSSVDAANYCLKELTAMFNALRGLQNQTKNIGPQSNAPHNKQQTAKMLEFYLNQYPNLSSILESKNTIGPLAYAYLCAKQTETYKAEELFNDCCGKASKPYYTNNLSS